MLDTKLAIAKILRYENVEKDPLEEAQDHVYMWLIDEENVVVSGSSGICYSFVRNFNDEQRKNTEAVVIYAKKPYVAKTTYNKYLSFVFDYYSTLAEEIGKPLLLADKSTLPFIFINPEAPAEIIFSFLSAVRIAHESHNYVNLWAKLVKAGVDEITAYIFLTAVRVVRKDGKRYNHSIPRTTTVMWEMGDIFGRHHFPYSPDYLSEKALSRIYKKQSVASDITFKEARRFDGVWSCQCGKYETGVFKKFFKENISAPKDNANPFAYVNNEYKTYTTKECVDILVGLAPKFEERFKE